MQVVLKRVSVMVTRKLYLLIGLLPKRSYHIMCGNGLKVRFVNEFVNTTNHHVGVSFQHSHLPNQNQGGDSL